MDFTGGLVLGLEWDPQGLASPQEGNRQWDCASLKTGKSERDTQRERKQKERERQRQRESQGGRGVEGGRLCPKFSWFFSRIPQF